MAQGGVEPAGTAAVFRGVTQLALDAKGRLAIPGKHRAALAGPSENGERTLVVTADPSRCLLVYPRATWEPIQARLMALSSFNDEIRGLQRLLVGHADDVEMDARRPHPRSAGAAPVRRRSSIASCSSARATSSSCGTTRSGSDADRARDHVPGRRSAARARRLHRFDGRWRPRPRPARGSRRRAGDPTRRHVRRRDVRPRRTRARDPRRARRRRDASSRSIAIPPPRRARVASTIRASSFGARWFSELADVLAALRHRARRRRAARPRHLLAADRRSRRAASRFAPTARSTCGWIPTRGESRGRVPRARDGARTDGGDTRLW